MTAYGAGASKEMSKLKWGRYHGSESTVADVLKREEVGTQTTQTERD